MLTFKKDTHQYFYNNQEVFSPNLIMSNIGVKNNKGCWSSFSGSEFIKEYPDNSYIEFGKKIHMIAAMILKGEKFKVNQEVLPYVNGIKKAIEYVHKFANDNKCNIVVDWKTSIQSQLYWDIQLGAYLGLFIEAIKNNVCVDLIETPLYSNVNDYAGTPDWCLFTSKNYCTITMSIRISQNNFTQKIRDRYEPKTDFNKFLTLLNAYKIIKN